VGNLARLGVFGLMALAIALSHLVEVELREEPMQLTVTSSGQAPAEPGLAEPAPQGLPSPQPSAVVQPAAPKLRQYVVKSGDTLGKISKQAYGTTRHWKAILEANKDLIPNAKAMRAGTKLRLPNFKRRP
jgi:nucleoid-associated protein YgaU